MAYDSHRVMAEFIPQYNNGHGIYRHPTEEPYKFDVTEQILAMGLEAAEKLEDDDYNTDALWHDHPISGMRPHDGPFLVKVDLEQVQALFEQQAEITKMRKEG